MNERWFHMLVSIAEGSCHGAEIQRRVHDRTNDAVKLYPVTLYRSLDEMDAAGLIEEAPLPADAEHNERRRYFRITAEGKKALAAEAAALEEAARMAHAVLGSRTAG